MEVIRSYDIARLVLGYLRDNKLDKAAKTFCKSSPYLTEEYELLRKGFWPVSLRHDHLPDIVREYCEIQSEVVQFVESLPENERERFPKHGTLLSKVHLLIRVAKSALTGKSEVVIGIKRRKTTSEETSTSLEATQEQDLPGYFPHLSKRRRVSPSFMCLANTRSKHVDVSSDEESLLQRSPCSTTTDPDLNASKLKSSTKLKPAGVQTKKTKEATKTATTAEKQQNEAPIPDFPALSEALLENVEFQNKLVENINKVLSSVKSPEHEKCDPVRKTCSSVNPPSDIVTQFEEMIKNILEETEKDPTFNELVADIVLSNNPADGKPSTSNQSTQCSPPIASCLPETVQTKPPHNELTLKERLRPRKTHTLNAALPTDAPKGDSKEHSKDDPKAGAFFTPCKPATNTFESVGDSSMSLSKLLILNPNETMTTSTPLISDSLLASSGSQLLNQLADNIFIDIGSGQAVPLLMANSMNTIFLDTTGDNLYDNLQLGKIIDSQNLETIDIFPQDPIRIPVTALPKRIDPPLASVAVVKNDPPSSSGIEAAPASTMVPSSFDYAAKTAEECATGINEGKLTPSVPMVAPELSRSLSTPRRKSSHIRVLNFKTPLKTRSETKLKYILPLIKSSNVESAKDTSLHPALLAKGNVNSAANANENKKPSTNLAIINESSNSSSNNEFAKTNADVTAIYQQISETPKRKSEGRKSCARTLSQPGSEETTTLPVKKKQISSKKKTPKKNAGNKSRAKTKSGEKRGSIEIEMPPTAPALPVNPMEAWARLRSIAPGQWDQHIREVCAHEEASNPLPHAYKKKRRKPKSIQSQTKANQVQDTETETNAEKPSNSATNESRPSPLKQSTKKALIEFKIATPIKVGKSPGKTKSKTSESARGAILEISNGKKDVEVGQQSTNNDVQCSEQQNNPCEKDTLEVSKPPAEAILESRTNNIGLLLDTPLKLDPTGIPITPGFRLPDTSTTPMIRMPSISRSQISLCKNPDLPTPNYAITPGASLTPFEKDTPRSGYMSNNPTDYSSGSSYYKPDESEELDKKLDAILAESRRNAKEQNNRQSPNNHTDVRDAREASPESSNQTVITTINRSSEASSKAITPLKQESVLPDDHSISSSSSSSDSSQNCSDSSSSSSDSDSSFNTNNSVKDDAHKSKKENQDINSDTLKTEGRNTTHNSVTPKKCETLKSVPSAEPNSEKKLADLVDKIKSRSVLGPMRTQQIETLNEKLVRVKGELKKDFAVMNDKRSCVVTSKKQSTRIKRPPARKKPPINARQSKCEVQKRARDKIEVLAALNLSQKNSVQPPLQSVNPAASKSFSNVAAPKPQVEEGDSKDSEETMEVRKAAYVLTNLSKGSAEHRRGEEVKKGLRKVAAKPNAGTVRKGRPRRLNTNAGEPTVKKVYLPHKPVTRGTSKQSKCTPEKLDKDTSNVAVTFEVSQNAESVAVTAIPTSASKQSEFSVNAMGIDSKPVKGLPSLTDPGESSSDQEEDYDQYDACEMASVGEKDTLRYIHVVYDQSNADKEANVPKNAYRSDNLASSIMNIFINGAPHQIVVADEIKLFSNAPSCGSLEQVSKKDEKSLLNTAKKKSKTADRKVKIKDTQREEIVEKESLGLSRVQPKINIKYKQRTTIKGKLKTDTIRCENSKSPLKVHFQPASQVEQEIVSENVQSDVLPAKVAATENQGSIKSEDIFAVLSLIHGNESEK